MTDLERKTAGGERCSGVRLGLLNNGMIVVAALIAVLLLYAVHQSIEGYQSLQTTTERYIDCQQAAVAFREASDYLTNESRMFAITGDAAHARNFAEEIEITRRRDNAVEAIDDFLTGEASHDYLKQALAHSNALAEVENRAMKLTAEAWGCDPSQLPECVLAVTLSPEDEAMTAEDKRAEAVELLFGEAYQQTKADIYDDVDRSITALIDQTRQQQLDASTRLSEILRRQRVLIVFLLVMLFAVVFCTYALVIRPIRKSVACIREQREIPVTGSHEMQFLARAFNDMFALHSLSTEKLTYSATHDSLTGLYNRTAYDAECRQVDQSAVGVLIVDVDEFKTYNDEYGHDVGDRVLQRVAKVLTESFRSDDFISRIGGDEFCVIMKNASSRMRALVAGKIRQVNDRLRHPEDGLPSISLSVGVAFGDREHPAGDIFKDADTALYQVKRGGKGGCGFY